MTPVGPGRRAYVRAVLDAYLRLPDTHDKPHPPDRLLAAGLHDADIPLTTVLDAILPASARRLIRPEDRPPLPPVRSPHYFVPVIEELRETPLPKGYAQYLRGKIAAKSAAPGPTRMAQVGEMVRKQRLQLSANTGATSFRIAIRAKSEEGAPEIGVREVALRETKSRLDMCACRDN